MYLSHHDKLEDMATERNREDLREEKAKSDHTTNSSECLQSLRSGRGLDQEVKPRLPGLVEESRLHLWWTGRYFPCLLDDRRLGERERRKRKHYTQNRRFPGISQHGKPDVIF